MEKCIMVIYDCVIENDILEILKENKLTNYTKISKVECEWKEDVRHLNSHIWPGTDSIIYIFIEEQDSQRIIETIQDYKESLENKVQMKAIVFPVDKVI